VGHLPLLLREEVSEDVVHLNFLLTPRGFCEAVHLPFTPREGVLDDEAVHSDQYGLPRRRGLLLAKSEIPNPQSRS